MLFFCKVLCKNIIILFIIIFKCDIFILEEVITMDDNMRNAWLDMISKVYTNLHNSDRVLRA